MSKSISKVASMELAFLAALDRVRADVDTSEIAEIQDWSRSVRGKFHGASVEGAPNLSKLKIASPPALGHPNATNEPVSPFEGVSGVVLGSSGSTASHRNVQYSQMAIPQLIAACTSESSEGAWSEFILRFHPFIARTIARVARRFGKVSPDLVDDLTQETFLKVCHDNLRALRGFVPAHENFFQGFLKVLATNVAVDHFRTTATFKMGGGGELNSPKASRVFSGYELSRGFSPEPERKVLLEKIDAILKTHAHAPNFERDYTIFWLHFRDGLTAKEIADSRGVELSVKGVESTLLRLTRQVRVALKLEEARPS